MGPEGAGGGAVPSAGGGMQDDSARLCEAVRAARASGEALRIRAGGSKDFYGRDPDPADPGVAGDSPAGGARVIDPGTHRGIVDYEPSELVLTVRAGTPLSEVGEALAAEGQMLPFEPPAFGATATVGGTVACGFSGPRRPFAGACRDHVLGARIVSGTGDILSFGGRVMKNVAGYDVSRLMAGAMGTLGILLEVSFKVLPTPETERTLVFECNARATAERLVVLGRRALGMSAACHDGTHLRLRFSGNERGVRSACAVAGGDTDEGGADFWEGLREHRLGFFDDPRPLWRLAVPPAARIPGRFEGDWLHDWAGAQRWLASVQSADSIFALARELGGHAVRFRGGDRRLFMQPLDPVTLRLHRRLRAAFDPDGLFNPGRLYAGLRDADHAD